MSPSSKPVRRFRDIVDNIELIVSDVGGMSRADFLVDRKTQDAVLFRLLRISEAATKLGADAEEALPEQPWAQIRAFGNLLRHQYDDIDLTQVWEIVRGNLPGLLKACERAIAAAAGEA